MLALVDAFFETLYPLPSYAFLHPETTKRRCRNGQMHRALASAICAVTSHHLDHAHSNDQDRWIQAAEQSIWMHLECPTIPRLQTLLLVIYHRIEAGRFQRAFMLTATAARFASAMRLNHERPVLDPIAREVRRRIVWSLKIVERYFCVGLPEFELCPIEGIYLDFPSSEDDFGAEQPGEHGAYSLHVRLEVVRRDIMKLTRGMTHLDEPIPSLMELVRQHATTLEEIASSMPSGDEVVVPDLLGSSWLTRRLPMYISYHQAHCDLYRILLPGYPEAAPSAVLATFPSHHLANAERQCLYHASAVIRILTGLNHDSPSRRLLEFDTAICAYHAARLMLFISRFGREREGRPSPEFAASRADLCLAALRRFFPSSVLAAPIIEELQYSIGVFRQQHQREGFAASELSRGRDREEQRAEERTCSGRRNSSPDQKLAVHSLLRQAEFEDEDEEKAVPADLASAEELSQSLQSARGDKVVPEPGPGSLRRTAEVNTAAIELGIGSMAPNMGVGGWGMGPFGIGQGLEGTRTVDVEQPLFAWGGPQDWNWLFDPEQPC